MERGQTIVSDDFLPFETELGEFGCPVCGAGLTRSDFETPERDYYCPLCSTRQTPSVLA
jgi:Zn finger protein HypA/HybF involved in hydrogenase expression